MDEERARYLHVVRKPDEEPQEIVSSAGSQPMSRDSAREVRHEGEHSASGVIGTAVMHAAMSWVACCMEQRGERVEVAQIAPGLFDATVYLSDDAGAAVGDILLRVRLELSSGPVLRTQVEPVHP